MAEAHQFVKTPLAVAFFLCTASGVYFYKKRLIRSGGLAELAYGTGLIIRHGLGRRGFESRSPRIYTTLKLFKKIAQNTVYNTIDILDHMSIIQLTTIIRLSL